MMQCGLQWFDSLEQLHGGTGPVVDEATARADAERAGGFLLAASDAGNRAGLIQPGRLGGHGLRGWHLGAAEARAAVLYARAYAQGFSAFGWLMQGDGPGSRT